MGFAKGFPQQMAEGAMTPKMRLITLCPLGLFWSLDIEVPWCDLKLPGCAPKSPVLGEIPHRGWDGLLLLTLAQLQPELPREHIPEGPAG